jgi:hypothetical protein
MNKQILASWTVNNSVSMQKSPSAGREAEDFRCCKLEKPIRQKKLNLFHLMESDKEVQLEQKSDHFSIDSAISTLIPEFGILMDILNGVYGHNMSRLARIYSFPMLKLINGENKCLNRYKNKGDFEDTLSNKIKGYVINSLLDNEFSEFSFKLLSLKLKEKGFVKYPGKLNKMDYFRITIRGLLSPNDIELLVGSITEKLDELKKELKNVSIFSI